MVTQSAGGTLIEVPMRDDCFDLDAILRAITPETRIVYVANPNNPTGTMLFANALDRFIERVPQHVMIALDEAYSDYAEFHAQKHDEIYSRSIEYVKQGRANVVVLRTFSKAHGLAGLRVGYGIADAQMLRYFAQVRTAFSVSGIAEAAALAALRDEAHIRLSVERNAEGVAYLAPRLQDLGFRVVPTTANFIYLETSENPGELGHQVQNEGCIIRSLVPWGIRNALRITVGTPEQNKTLIEALKRVAQRVPSAR